MPFAMVLSVERPDDVSARKFSDFSKVGMADAAELWETEFIGLHFQTFSAAKYRYQRRRPSTLKKKKKLAAKGKVKKGGAASLVWSGTFEEQMARPGRTRVFPSRFVIIKPASFYITDRPKGRRPNMVREVTTVIPSEEKRMANVYRDRVAEQLNEFRATRRRKFKG